MSDDDDVHEELTQLKLIQQWWADWWWWWWWSSSYLVCIALVYSSVVSCNFASRASLGRSKSGNLFALRLFPNRSGICNFFTNCKFLLGRWVFEKNCMDRSNRVLPFFVLAWFTIVSSRNCQLVILVSEVCNVLVARIRWNVPALKSERSFSFSFFCPVSAGRGEIVRTWYDGHIFFLRYRVWSSQDSRVKRKRTGTHRKLWLWHRLDGVRRKEGKQSHVHWTCSLMVVSEEQQG